MMNDDYLRSGSEDIPHPLPFYFLANTSLAPNSSY